MSSKLSSEQRKYLRERIASLVGHAMHLLQDRAIARRTQIQTEVMKTSGLEKAKEHVNELVEKIEAFNKRCRVEGEKLVNQANTMNDQFRSVVGCSVMNIGYARNDCLTGFSFSGYTTGRGTPFDRMVEEAMSVTPEGAQIRELEDLRRQLEDRLMLDYDGKSGTDILTEVQESIDRIVNKAKSLPSPKK